MKRDSLYIILLTVILLAGCEYDNFEEPKSTLSGNVVYDGNPVGVRTNEIQLELWQDGYDLNVVIPVFVAHDGSYSVSLFDGQYKMVRRSGAPWLPQLSDTLVVDVRGNTAFDVPVTPYFAVSNESFQYASGNITANFNVEKIVETADLAEVRLYIGKSILTDQNRIEQAVDADLANITEGQSSSLTVQLSQNLAGLDYVFVRVGVRATVSSEFYYTQVQKITLN